MNETEEHVEALLNGRAMVDLSDWRKVQIEGSDASSWLQDLLTADVAGLQPGNGHRSLLLSPTGRVRADIHVVRDERGFLLFQAREQPEHIGLLLSPYLLSADVSLRDVSAELTLIAVVGAAADRVGLAGFAPSALGSGLDLVGATGKASWRIEDALTKAGLTEVSPGAVETWRIRAGVARMGPDFDTDSLPAEAGLDEAIDRTKGCFLGQESVARIDNTGHPPRSVVHVSVSGRVQRGDRVFIADLEVGQITSAAPPAAVDQPSFALARVGWDAAPHDLSLADGRPLARVAAPD